MKGADQSQKENRVYISAMVTPHSKEVFYQAAAAYKSGGQFLDAVMAALEGLVLPQPSLMGSGRSLVKAKRAGEPKVDSGDTG